MKRSRSCAASKLSRILIIAYALLGMCQLGLIGAAPAPDSLLPVFVPSEGSRTITRSVRIKPGKYELKDPEGKGALRIEADNVTVDMSGAILTSCDVRQARLETLEGIGINVEGRRNVTIRNAKVYGYRFNIRALGCENLRIENCDVSYSRAQRVWESGVPINSMLALRSIEAWRSYGTGIWIEKSNGSVVRRCRGNHAQNGLIVADSNNCLITGNDFSFNSGWAIALWQSCDNVISWNLADFVVRPDRSWFGCDSAAICIVNQSNRNFIVGNSMTHSGDGLFLTNVTDTGYDGRTERYIPRGSSDDNVIAQNDCSWSPGNALEGTFSWRNVYYKNTANDSGHGFWLGFSCDSLIIGNDIRRNANSGIAVEQGSGNLVEKNVLDGNKGTAVRLWAMRGKEREGFPSKNLEIRDNIIRNSPAAIDLTNSTDYYVGNNVVENAPVPSGLSNTKEPNETTAVSRFESSVQHTRLKDILATRPKGFKLYRETGGPCGPEWIQTEEYAPRDFRAGLAAWRTAGWGAIDLFLVSSAGAKIAAPEWTVVTQDPRDPRRFHIAARPLDSDIGEIRDCKIKLTSGKRSQEIGGTFVNTTWKVRWFRWDQPRKLEWNDEAGWRALFAGQPLREENLHELGSSFRADRPAARAQGTSVALTASTRVRFPAGKYKFGSDYFGGLRVFVDGKAVIENWSQSWWTQRGETVVSLTEGVHEITIHYGNEAESTMLKLYWGQPAG